MGDILGGGLILTLGSFMIVLAGLDTGSAYGGIGSSRAVMVAILAEPTLIVVFVGITLLAKSMLPFVVNHLLVGNPAVYWSPAHLFLIAAFFALLLVETDRLPIHSSTHIEVYMIEEARILEYSGPLLGSFAMGLDDEAIHPLHDLLQRSASAVGALAGGCRYGCGRVHPQLFSANSLSSLARSSLLRPRSPACAFIVIRSCSRPPSCLPFFPSSETN